VPGRPGGPILTDCARRQEGDWRATHMRPTDEGVGRRWPSAQSGNRRCVQDVGHGVGLPESDTLVGAGRRFSSLAFVDVPLGLELAYDNLLLHAVPRSGRVLDAQVEAACPRVWPFPPSFAMSSLHRAASTAVWLTPWLEEAGSEARCGPRSARAARLPFGPDPGAKTNSYGGTARERQLRAEV